jgi:hypothetical protein
MAATTRKAEGGMRVNPHTGQFRTAANRLHGERKGRLESERFALRYHVAFLDDALRALLPTDLVLIGAPSGLGKTDLALNIAATNAQQGKRVHYFALEAEPLELERRTKFALLSRCAYEAQHPARSKLNYADWLLGRVEDVCAEFDAKVDGIMTAGLSTLWTFYRGNDFAMRDLRQQVLDVHEASDLIIVDHLHYIDSEDDNEQRALGDTVKALRDLALNVGKPVILIAHLRKRETGSKRLVPTLDDFHGSSNIAKICTQAIVLERCHTVQSPKWYLAPTFFAVLKDRRAGAPPYAALTHFDKRTKSYQGFYTLGRLTRGGSDWEPLSLLEKPEWAHHHRELEKS